MKRLLFALMLISSPALAKDSTVTLPDEAWQVVLNALDVQVKTQGLSAADNAVFIKNKIVEAAKPVPEPKKDDAK